MAKMNLLAMTQDITILLMVRTMHSYMSYLN
jgi:hypothetical protein